MQYYLLKLNQEDINHLNRYTMSNETEGVINSLQTKKSPGMADPLLNPIKPSKKFSSNYSIK
jgi:hypothetical protein